jgi:hypothetical protein
MKSQERAILQFGARRRDVRDAHHQIMTSTVAQEAQLPVLP